MPGTTRAVRSAVAVDAFVGVRASIARGSLSALRMAPRVRTMDGELVGRSLGT
jgi:hypothetical protein